MSSWPVRPLSEVIALQRGHDLPTTSRTAGPIPVIGSGGVGGWHNEAKAEGPGVVIGRATNLGVPYWSDTPYWPLNTALYVTDFKGNDPRFIYHLFQVLDLSGYNSGSVQPMLNRNYIAQVPVQLPPIEEQRRISSVLGALDDLIATNTAVIRDILLLADTLAEGLSNQGSNCVFGDVCDVFGGGTPSTKDPFLWHGDIRWATPSDITALPSPYLFDTARHITQAGLDKCASRLLPVGTILMTSRATIGAFAVNEVPTAVNQGFIAVHPRVQHDRWFLFHEMRRRVPEFIQRANGSTFLELSRGVFKNLTVCWPSEEVRKEIDATLDPLHKAAGSLQAEAHDLASTRDELLPLLMSGRVRVGDVAA